MLTSRFALCARTIAVALSIVASGLGAEARASSILIYRGTGTLGTAGANLATNLTSLNHSVTSVIDPIALPSDLTPYSAVYYTNIEQFTQISLAVRTQLVAYVQGGGDLYLQAEADSTYVAWNNGVEEILNALVPTAGITMGTSASASNSFNPGAVGGLTTTPNSLTSFATNGSGSFSGSIAAENVIATDGSGNILGVAYTFAGAGGGQLIVMGDINYLFESTTSAAYRKDIIENFQTFFDSNPPGGIVPEPGTLALAAVGLVGIARARSRG